MLKEHPNCDILRLYIADTLRLHLTVKETPNSELYERQSQNEDAYELYENMLFEEALKINGVLQMICHLLCKEKKFVEAEKYANLSRDIAILLDLGDYTAYASNFLLAVEKKDKASVIEMLEHMINGIETYTDYMDSDLYSHKKFCQRANFDSAKTILRNSLKNKPELDFIKNEPNAKKLFQKLGES